MTISKLKKWTPVLGILGNELHCKASSPRMVSSASNMSAAPIPACLNPIPTFMLSVAPERRKFGCIPHRFRPLMESEFQTVFDENIKAFNELKEPKMGARVILTKQLAMIFFSIPVEEREELTKILKDANIQAVTSESEISNGKFSKCLLYGTKLPLIIRWEKPDNGCLKCNVDASYSLNYQILIASQSPVGSSPPTKCNAICAGLFRNSDGAQVGNEFVELLFDMKDVLEAELNAILFGLEEFWYQPIEEKKSCKRLVLECDSFSAVRIANGKFRSEKEKEQRGALYREILSYKEKLEDHGFQIDINYVNRAINHVADALVSKSADQAKARVMDADDPVHKAVRTSEITFAKNLKEDTSGLKYFVYLPKDRKEKNQYRLKRALRMAFLEP